MPLGQALKFGPGGTRGRTGIIISRSSDTVASDNQHIEAVNRITRRWAIGLWLALTVVIVAKTAQNPQNHSTYPLFHDAALAWWDEVDVYDRNVFGGDYRYGPSFAMILGPIAWLPYTMGAVIWAVLNIGVAYWAIVSLLRRVLPGGESPLARYLVLAISVFPCVHCLYACQTNLLIFSLVAFAAIAILDQRWWLAAFLLSIPVHIKVWPLAAGLLLMAFWPRRLAWRLPIALMAMAALPLVVKSPAWVWEQYVQWYRHLVGPAQIRHTYRDAWTIWELISSPVNPRSYALFQLVSAAGILGLCLWRSRHASSERAVLLVLVSWTTWQLLCGPGTERNTFALIAPLTSWAVVIAFIEARARWWMGLAFLLTVLSAVGGVEDLSSWLKAMHPVGVAMFFVWFAVYYCKESGRVSDLSKTCPHISSVPSDAYPSSAVTNA
jgi:hypothetical protein